MGCLALLCHVQQAIRPLSRRYEVVHTKNIIDACKARGMSTMMSRVLGPSGMVIIVFVGTSMTLLTSIARDLAAQPDLPQWAEHLDSFLENS